MNPPLALSLHDLYTRQLRVTVHAPTNTQECLNPRWRRWRPDRRELTWSRTMEHAAVYSHRGFFRARPGEAESRARATTSAGAAVAQIDGSTGVTPHALKRHMPNYAPQPSIREHAWLPCGCRDRWVWM